jgi:hypothetical protein
MLAQHGIEHPSGGREELIIRHCSGVPLTIGGFKYRTQEIRKRFVGTEHPEIALILIEPGYVAQEPTQYERILAVNGPG